MPPPLTLTIFDYINYKKNNRELQTHTPIIIAQNMSFIRFYAFYVS